MKITDTHRTMAATIFAAILAKGPSDNNRPEYSRDFLQEQDVETDNPDGLWLVDANAPKPWKALFYSEPDTGRETPGHVRLHVLRTWEERVARYAFECVMDLEAAGGDVEELTNPKA